MMTDLLMWFDNSKTPLTAKVKAAAARYQQRFGSSVTVCLLNPADFDPAVQVDGIELKPTKSVLRHHLQVGNDNSDRSLQQ